MDVFFRHAIAAVEACKERRGFYMSKEQLSEAMGFSVPRQTEVIRARLKALGIVSSRQGQNGGYMGTSSALDADLRDLWHMIYGGLPAMEFAHPLVDLWAGIPVELPIPIKGVGR